MALVVKTYEDSNGTEIELSNLKYTVPLGKFYGGGRTKGADRAKLVQYIIQIISQIPEETRRNIPAANRTILEEKVNSFSSEQTAQVWWTIYDWENGVDAAEKFTRFAELVVALSVVSPNDDRVVHTSASENY
jgi:hypothetical protein